MIEAEKIIGRSLLFEAKAFLCWEKFNQLSIKLIPIDEAVAFFYPPTGEFATIHLFYKSETQDFTSSVCLLFHEAGHFQQWQQWSNQGKGDEFWRSLNLDKGDEKIKFEREAWEHGHRLLQEFIERLNIKSSKLLDCYAELAQRSLLTYHE